MSRRTLVVALVVSLLGSAVVLAGRSRPADAVEPAAVTIAGSLQSELGCPGDWQPECAATQLTFDADDDVWQGDASPSPAGSWEYKAALNGTWDENYGAGAVRDGPNIPLVLGGAEPTVKFFYDDATHWVTDNQTSVIAVAPGQLPERARLRDRLGPGVPAVVAAGRRRRRRRAVLHVHAAARRLRVQGRDRRDVGRELRRAAASVTAPTSRSRSANAGDVVTFSYDAAQPRPRHQRDARPSRSTTPRSCASPCATRSSTRSSTSRIPDRFNDGNPRNNCGDYDGACVAGRHAGERADARIPAEREGLLPRRRPRGPARASCRTSTTSASPRSGSGRSTPTRAVQSDTTDLYGHSAGYHGYWILDFLHVDPHLGTNAEFAALVDEAHGRGIKVFMDIVTNHTADVIQLEGNAGYRNKRDFPYRDVERRSRSTTRDYAYSGQPDYTFPEVDATSFPYTPVLPPGEENVKNPAWLNDPLLYHNRGQHELQRRELALRRLLRPRRPVDRAARGRRGDGRHLLVLDRGVRRRRVPHRHDQAREHGVLAGVRAGHPRRRRGARHRRLLRLRRGVRPAVRLAVHERVLDRGPAAVDDRLRLPARRARTSPRRARPTDDLRDFFASDDYYTDADSNAYAMPTFLGNHDMGRIGYFLQRVDQPGAERRRAAGPLEARARADVLRPRPAGRLLRRRAGLHRRRRRQGRPRGHVRQRRAVVRRQRSDRHRRDHVRRQLRPRPPAVQGDPRLRQARTDQHPALRSGAQIHRFSSDGPGVYAFSRIDRDERVEYVVALNNSEARGHRRRSRRTRRRARGTSSCSRAGTAPGVPDRSSRPAPTARCSVTVPAARVRHLPGQGARCRPATRRPAIDDHEPRSTATPRCSAPTRWDGHAGRRPHRGRGRARRRRPGRGDVRRARGRRRLRADRHRRQPAVPRVLRRQPPARPRGHDAVVPGHRRTTCPGTSPPTRWSNVGVEFPEPTAPATPLRARPLQPARRRLRRPHHRQLQRLLGPAPVGRRHRRRRRSPTGPRRSRSSARTSTAGSRSSSSPTTTLPVNFIVHRGDTKDPDNSPDRSFDPATTPEIWLRQGDVNDLHVTGRGPGLRDGPLRRAPTARGVTIDATSNGSRSRPTLRPTRSTTTARCSAHVRPTSPRR